MAKMIDARNISIRYKISSHRKSSVKNLVLSSVKKRANRDGGKEFWALRNITFDVEPGDIFGVIGKNGSGKTTLLRTLAGIYKPDEGSIDVNGTVSSLLSLGAGFHEDLTGYENIFLTGVLTGFTEKEIQEKLVDIVGFSGLEDFIFQPVKTYSSGMKARLGFSIAIFLQRDIMLIDEILGVGDFKFKEKSQKKMMELIQSDSTVILVSHETEVIEKYCNRCLWIHEGEQRALGPTAEVLKEYLKS